MLREITEKLEAEIAAAERADTQLRISVEIIKAYAGVRERDMSEDEGEVWGTACEIVCDFLES